VEVVGLRARVSCRLVEPAAPEPELLPRAAGAPRTRSAWFRGHGSVDATVVRLEELAVGEVLAGPALVESAVTTVVVDPGATVERTASGGLLILPWGEP
jgi:N-methylhydantoinase A